MHDLKTLHELVSITLLKGAIFVTLPMRLDKNLRQNVRLFQKMVAVYDYDPMRQSPSKDKSKELNLRKGQYVTVIGDMVSCVFSL